MQLLGEQARTLLEEERDLLQRLLDLLRRLGGDEEVVGPLSEMVEQLDELFLLVIVGEFNAGKSTVVNALFRDTVMEQGPVPTTAKITLIRHGTSPLNQQISEFLEEKRIDNPLLQNLTIVDTPGTNSIVQQHQRITEDFIPRSDLVLFVTSFDRPLTESERQFLSYIREDWGRRLVVVLNKADLADSESDLETVETYLKTNLSELLGTEPTIFPVSAKKAFDARRDGREQEELWHESRFQALESFLTETLSGPERLALKLAAPLETARTRIRRLEDHLEERRELLTKDERTLQELRDQVDASQDRLIQSYQRPIQRIDERLVRMKARGIRFLEDTIRASVSKIQLMRDRERLKATFRDRVIADLERDIQDAVDDAVDALMAQTTNLRAGLVQTFSQRVHEVQESGRPELDRSFDYDRSDVVRATLREAEASLEEHDLQAETGRMMENAHDAVQTFLGTGAGAAGIGLIGGLLLVLAPVLDVLGGFGLATGAVLAILGASVLPRQRKKAIREFSEHVDGLREGVRASLESALESDVDDTLERVWATVEPYETFISNERATVNAASEEVNDLREAVTRLEQRIEETVGSPGV